MAKLQRKTQKIFSSNAATNEHAVFGTMKNIVNNEQPQYSMDVEVLQSQSAFLLGWQNAVVAGFAPFLEEMNGVFYVITSQIAYLLQSGMAEWDSTTDYYTDNFCRVGNKIYYSLTDNNLNNNPETDTTNWSLFKGGGITTQIIDYIDITLPTPLNIDEISIENL